MQKKKSKHIRQIISAIQETHIATFIVQEVEETLAHLNVYKLENIIVNIEMMKNFLYDLDKRNTEMYRSGVHNGALSQKNTIAPDKYISHNGWCSLSKKDRNNFTKTANEDKAQKSTIIKGLFLLSVCDFAQGSICRLENKYYYHIDDNYIKQKK